MKKNTVREWMNFIGTDDENQLYGVQRKNGPSCKPMNYQPMEIFFSIYSGYLDDIVINVYPYNFEKNGKNHCLFLTEEPINSNKMEREIFEYLFKKAERRGDIHIQENRKDFLKIMNNQESEGVGLIFNEKGDLSQIEVEY